MDTKTARQPKDVLVRQIALTSFDLPDIAPVQTCRVGKGLLRQTSFLAQFSHSITEFDQLEVFGFLSG